MPPSSAPLRRRPRLAPWLAAAALALAPPAGTAGLATRSDDRPIVVTIGAERIDTGIRADAVAADHWSWLLSSLHAAYAACEENYAGRRESAAADLQNTWAQTLTAFPRSPELLKWLPPASLPAPCPSPRMQFRVAGTGIFLHDVELAAALGRELEAVRQNTCQSARTVQHRRLKEKLEGLEDAAGASPTPEIGRDAAELRRLLEDGLPPIECPKVSIRWPEGGETARAQLALVLPSDPGPGAVRISGTVTPYPGQFDRTDGLTVVPLGEFPLPRGARGGASIEGLVVDSDEPGFDPAAFTIFLPEGGDLAVDAGPSGCDDQASTPGRVRAPCANVTVPGPAPGSGSPRAPNGYAAPPVCNTGGVLRIDGPFDGVGATTAVTFGKRPGRVIAETPGAAFVEVPADLPPGPHRVDLAEEKPGGRETTSFDVCAMALKASAGDTSLRTGQRTDLQVSLHGPERLPEQAWAGDGAIELRIERTSPNIVLDGERDGLILRTLGRKDFARGAYVYKGRIQAKLAGGFSLLATATPIFAAVAGTAPQQKAPSPACTATVTATLSSSGVGVTVTALFNGQPRAGAAVAVFLRKNNERTFRRIGDGFTDGNGQVTVNANETVAAGRAQVRVLIGGDANCPLLRLLKRL